MSVAKMFSFFCRTLRRAAACMWKWCCFRSNLDKQMFENGNNFRFDDCRYVARTEFSAKYDAILTNNRHLFRIFWVEMLKFFVWHCFRWQRRLKNSINQMKVENYTFQRWENRSFSKKIQSKKSGASRYLVVLFWISNEMSFMSFASSKKNVRTYTKIKYLVFLSPYYDRIITWGDTQKCLSIWDSRIFERIVAPFGYRWKKLR